MCSPIGTRWLGLRRSMNPIARAGGTHGVSRLLSPRELERRDFGEARLDRHANPGGALSLRSLRASFRRVAAQSIDWFQGFLGVGLLDSVAPIPVQRNHQRITAFSAGKYLAACAQAANA